LLDIFSSNLIYSWEMQRAGLDRCW